MKEWIAESGANLGGEAAQGTGGERSSGREAAENQPPESTRANTGEEALALRNRELDLIERVVRVEDELKNLREVMEERFGKIDERFSKMDERFEAQRELMDERFSHMEKCTAFIQWVTGIGFTAIGILMVVLNYFG